MSLLPRPKAPSCEWLAQGTNGSTETPGYQLALTEYLAHCANIGNIIAHSNGYEIAECRVKRYLRMVDAPMPQEINTAETRSSRTGEPKDAA